MSNLVNIANQQFKLPEGLEFKEFEGHPHTFAVVAPAKADRSDNPLGIIESVDANAIRGGRDEALKDLVTRHGAKPVAP